MSPISQSVPNRGVPELGVVGEREPRRRHTNYDVEVPVERDLCSDDPGVGGEVSPPGAVGQDEHSGRRSRILAVSKRSSELCGRAQDGKEVGAHPSRVDAQRRRLGAEQRGSRFCPLSKGTIAVKLCVWFWKSIRSCGAMAISPCRASVRVQIHEAVRSLEAEWLEEHAVHEAERRCAGADRERQGGERDQGERGRARESARSVAQFLDGGFHNRVDRRGGSRDATERTVDSDATAPGGYGVCMTITRHLHGTLRPSKPADLQWATFDRYISKRAAQRYFDAAGDPKTQQWYVSSHEFTDPRARSDRDKFLATELRFRDTIAGDN